MPIAAQSTLPLSRNLDVSISISRPQTELATDMTMIAFVTPLEKTVFANSEELVRYYSSLDAVLQDFDADSPAYFAASAFFSRSDRPSTMAICGVDTTPTPAKLIGGPVSLESLQNLTKKASFGIEIDGHKFTVMGMTTDGNPNGETIATFITTAIADSGATCTWVTDHFEIVSDVASDNSKIGYAYTPIIEGLNDISEKLGLTEGHATIIEGHTPTVPEGLIKAQTYARCAGRAIFAWVLDSQWRDTQIQKDVADYLAAQDPAYFSACTNSPLAYDITDTTNIAYYCKDKGYNGVSVIYHENPQVYPDMSYAALALSVNYAQNDSTITMKFKELTGIEPSGLTESQVSNLAARNCNCYVLMGNTARVVREGVQSADTWFTDSFVNLMNYKEELQVEVFNVFLRNKKVPYTTAGQNMLVSAAAKINSRYTRNGTFADREVETTNNETGIEVLPATSISPTLVGLATTSERAARIAPPIAITCYEAGAFHSIHMTVTVYN